MLSSAFLEQGRTAKGDKLTRLLLVFFLFFNPVAFAEETQDAQNSFLQLPAYDLEFDDQKPNEVTVGDKLRLKIVGLKTESHLKFEMVSDPKNHALQTWVFLNIENSSDTEFKFIAVPLKAGIVKIPSMGIKKADTADSVFIGRTNPFDLDVKSSIKKDDPKSKEPVPPRPPVSLAFPSWIITAAGILLLLLFTGIIVALIYFSRKIKPVKNEALPQGPPKPEDELALVALAELEKEGFLKKGLFKKHYFRTSEILKEYLGRRFSFDAPESTASEILMLLEKQKVTSVQVLDEIEKLFSNLDRVKFTDYIPQYDEGSLVLQEARQLVTKTRKPRTAGSNAV